MKDIFNDLIIKLSSYYDSIGDKSKFTGENLIDCEFIDNLSDVLEELNIEYDDSKLDFLAKNLLYVYNYDKACLLMTKKYLDCPNNGKVSNIQVYDFCKSLENADEDTLREIKDSFYIKAGDFGMLEKVSIYYDINRNYILESQFGVSKIGNAYISKHSRFSSCYRGTVEALRLKDLGIKEYHQKLLGKYQTPKVYQLKRTTNK